MNKLERERGRERGRDREAERERERAGPETELGFSFSPQSVVERHPSRYLSWKIELSDFSILLFVFQEPISTQHYLLTQYEPRSLS
jgi:hypothetical protein